MKQLALVVCLAAMLVTSAAVACEDHDDKAATQKSSPVPESASSDGKAAPAPAK